MSDARSRYRALFSRGEGTERVQFFSDAVFAIAMTLLVLEIRLPEGAEEDLGGALLVLWPSFFAYALSFAIIGLNWITHHRKFRYIVRWDNGLLRINLLFLFAVTFVPFPTSVMAEHGDETVAVVLYALAVSALSLLQLWIWVHSYRAGLMDEQVDEGVYRVVRRNLLPVPLVFLLSIPVALFAPLVATLSWILIWPVSVLIGRIGSGVSRTPRRNPE
jgi:uncharacterized membrane protein